MRKLHVFHQQLAIHEQFLTMRAIDSVGAPDQGGVLLGERGEMPRLVKLFLCLVVYKVQLRASLPSSPSFYTFSLTHSHLEPPIVSFLPHLSHSLLLLLSPLRKAAFITDD